MSGQATVRGGGGPGWGGGPGGEGWHRLPHRDTASLLQQRLLPSLMVAEGDVAGGSLQGGEADVGLGEVQQGGRVGGRLGGRPEGLGDWWRTGPPLLLQGPDDALHGASPTLLLPPPSCKGVSSKGRSQAVSRERSCHSVVWPKVRDTVHLEPGEGEGGCAGGGGGGCGGGGMQADGFHLLIPGGFGSSAAALRNILSICWGSKIESRIESRSENRSESRSERRC